MLRLVIARHIVEPYQQNGIVHLPDFLIYNFDKEEYQIFWQEIASYPKHRIYTDGIQVFCVGWFRSFFESVKGWFGFENHCHPKRVEMTLAKIAYVGYLKGFRSTMLSGSDSFPISRHFKHLINLPRTNQTSGELQNLLMSYFMTHSYAFPELHEFIHDKYSFGQTFIQAHLAYLVPSLDPQDRRTIEVAIEQINYYKQRVNNAYCFKSSPFAEAYAQSLAKQQQYYEALEWSSEVKNKFKEPFIRFYLMQEKVDPHALKNAVELIAALALSTVSEEQHKAVDYIKTNFSYEEQAFFLKPYTELSNQVARSYLIDAQKEKNKWQVTKFFTGNKTLEFLSHAVRIAPKILENDDSMQDITIQEEWVVYQFNRAIEGSRFQDADALYELYPNVTFNKSKLERLQEYYINQLSVKKSQIAQDLLNHNTDAAGQIAWEQIALARKIERINTPQENLVMTASINYAATLLAIDNIKHPLLKEADLEQLNKAQNILNEYYFLNGNTSLEEILNQISQRKIDCLIAKLGVPIDYNDSLSTKTTFVKEHQREIDQLKKELQTFIALNEQKRKEMRQALAKVYYLLADTLVYFEEKNQESIFYFKKAKELMPENLYYKLRYLEMIEDEERNEVREQIGNIAYLHSIKYSNYMIERWSEEKIMSNGFDIHTVRPDDSGIFNTISRVLGF